MPDAAAEPDTAAGRAAAQETSALSHPAVDPDATAGYGVHPDQVIDFYAPRGAGGPGGPVPVVVVLHGGSWRAPYDRRHVSPFADFLAHRGFAVASVEYRRGAQEGPGGGSGEAGGSGGAGSAGGGPVAGRWPDTFADVAAALDALPALVRRHLPGADPRRTVLTGHSAGGHLALWAAARHLLPADAAWRLDRPAPLRGVVALAPIADLEVARELRVCGGAALELLGGEEHFEERRPYVDPALLLPTGIATTLVQGRADVDVPQAVAEAYADAAAKAGEVVGLTLLEDVGNFPLIDPAADACAVVAEEIAQLAW
ncbi:MULTISPECIES: alpha/beta hydrolase-fold protein [Streptomyces]|uniref:alpha/beta hydrolase family protein n=1 Tax=Streptomyces sp. CC71 TaxID=1770211 RepID=UPI0007824261|nr:MULTISPECIES: alpha/beta hydrolase-fold protein [Streptomyces]KYK16592.1 lipase [Streptomyces sp. CC71]